MNRTTLLRDWEIVDRDCVTKQPWWSAVRETSTRVSGSEECPRAPRDGEQWEDAAPRTYRLMYKFLEWVGGWTDPDPWLGNSGPDSAMAISQVRGKLAAGVRMLNVEQLRSNQSAFLFASGQ